MSTWTVPKMWEGGDAWIIGGGPSMPRQFNVPEDTIQDVCSGKQFPEVYSPFLEPIHKKHIIGVNNAYQIGTWMDAMLFGDSGWYLRYRKAIAQWPGIKVSCAPRFANLPDKKMEGIKYLAKDPQHSKGLTSNPRKVSWNSNSGAAAMNLAVHFGAKRLFLLGFDMVKNGKSTHWHGSHHKGQKKLPYFRHLKGFPIIAVDAELLGVKIFNVNLHSRIEAFPRITLEEALN